MEAICGYESSDNDDKRETSSHGPEMGGQETSIGRCSRETISQVSKRARITPDDYTPIALSSLIPPVAFLPGRYVSKRERHVRAQATMCSVSGPAVLVSSANSSSSPSELVASTLPPLSNTPPASIRSSNLVPSLCCRFTPAAHPAPMSRVHWNHSGSLLAGASLSSECSVWDPFVQK